MKTRLLVFMLSLITVFNCFAPISKAEDTAMQQNYQEAEKAVISAWDEYSDFADISSCNINISNFYDLVDYITYRNTEYFYVETYSCTYNEKNIITKLSFEYTFDKSLIPEMSRVFEEKCQSIVDSIPKNLSQAEILLYLHDYIAKNTAYDLRIHNNIDTSEDKYIRNAYGCIVNQKSVCEGISEAFIYLCKKVSIEAYLVTSTVMHHEWNMVKLGDNYYHIDITQDAPVYNLNENGFHQAPGDVTHTFFLKSDEEIKNEVLGNSVHHDWEAPFAATDSKTFKDAFWVGTRGVMNYYNGDYYFIKNQALVKHNYTMGTTTSLFSLAKSIWQCTCGKRHYWNGSYARAVMDDNGKFLYYTSCNNIYLYNLENSSIALVHNRAEKGFIYSILHKDGDVLVSVRDDDHNASPFYVDYKAQIIKPETSVVLGDVNFDGAVGVTDALALKKHLIKEYEIINAETADIRVDEKIDAKDMLVLKKILAHKQG